MAVLAPPAIRIACGRTAAGERIAAAAAPVVLPPVHHAWVHHRVLLSRGLIAPGGAQGVGSMPHAVATVLLVASCHKGVLMGGSGRPFRVARSRQPATGGAAAHQTRNANGRRDTAYRGSLSSHRVRRM